MIAIVAEIRGSHIALRRTINAAMIVRALSLLLFILASKKLYFQLDFDQYKIKSLRQYPLVGEIWG